MRKYRSLIAWQRAREATIHTFTATNDAYHPRANAVFDQLRRAVLSIELNIVEGYALGTRAQFVRHLRIAVGSAAEAECTAEIAETLQYLPAPAVKRLSELLDEILACLHGLLRRLRP
jgi:four helix bundle protein